MDKEKTQGGTLVTGYECNPESAVDDFLLKKQLYHKSTGRKQPKGRDVVCYHVRQSFHPDEKLTPEQVNQLGHELAMKVTDGNHQFIVCTHTDGKHLHNHIIFNAVNLDYEKKFVNEYNSSFKIRTMSDEICLNHGLKIVENPKEKENSQSYDVWADKKKGINWKAVLEADIVRTVKECDSLEEFKKKLKELGYEVKGKERLSIKHINRDNYMRTDRVSRKFDYSIKGLEFALKHKIFLPIEKKIDLTAKKSIRDFVSLEDKTGGLEHWAKIQNIKEFVNTQNFLETHGLTDYKDLAFALEDKQSQVLYLRNKIKALENDIEKSSNLKKHIVNFAKTKKVYDSYKSTKYKEEFYADHRADIVLHESAKQAFSELGLKKLPKAKELSENISTMYSEKSELYAKYKTLQAELKELQTVKNNVDISEGKEIVKKEKEI